MADLDLRDRLNAYVMAEPPRTLTAEAVLRAGQRARRVHRLGLASAVVVLVATAAVVPTVLLRPTPLPAPVGTTPPFAGGVTLDLAHLCTAAEAPTPPAAVRVDASPVDPTGGPEFPDAEIDRTAAQLRCAVSEMVAAKLPGFRFTELHSALQGDRPRLTEPLEFYVEVPGPRFVTDAVAVDESGAVTIGFDVAGHSRLGGCEPTSCTVRRGPQGEQVLVLEGTGGRHVEVRRGRTVIDVWELLVDGRLPLSAQEDGQPRDELPLTVDQLIEIAVDPRLDVFTHQ
jgi:hypothetical protein